MKKQKAEQKPRHRYMPVSMDDPIIIEYKASGDAAKVDKLVSMAYLTNSIANAYNEEAIEILEKYTLVQKKFKTKVFNLKAAFDAYDKELFSMVSGEAQQRAFCLDYDILKEILDEYLNAEDYKKVKEKFGIGKGY